jgi:hypothetical protein
MIYAYLINLSVAQYMSGFLLAYILKKRYSLLSGNRFLYYRLICFYKLCHALFKLRYLARTYVPYAVYFAILTVAQRMLHYKPASGHDIGYSFSQYQSQCARINPRLVLGIILHILYSLPVIILCTLLLL